MNGKSKRNDQYLRPGIVKSRKQKIAEVKVVTWVGYETVLRVILLFHQTDAEYSPHTKNDRKRYSKIMWRKRMLSERWFSRRNVHHHQGQCESGLKSKLTDEEQQQKNKINSGALHCCGSQLNYWKLITLSIALEILLFNYAFFLSRRFVLFLFLFIAWSAFFSLLFSIFRRQKLLVEDSINFFHFGCRGCC